MIRKDVKVARLKQVPLFSECSRQELADIALIADEIQFPGRTLIEEGAAGHEFIVVLSGSVEIRRDGNPAPLKGDTRTETAARLRTGSAEVERSNDTRLNTVR
jgi:hypothetical protein